MRLWEIGFVIASVLVLSCWGRGEWVGVGDDAEARKSDGGIG
jgi:hypothetical protein